MPRMCGHASVGFFRRHVLFSEGKHSGFRHTVVQVRKVNFFNR